MGHLELSKWYHKVTSDLSKLPDCIDYFESELMDAKLELNIKGKSLEKHCAELPGVFDHRFSQLQEIEAILEFLNIEKSKKRSERFKHYFEHYNRSLTSREVEKYIDGDDEYINSCLLVNEFALIRNKYLSLTKSLDTKQWQITNITKLRVAGMDDAMLE